MRAKDSPKVDLTDWELPDAERAADRLHTHVMTIARKTAQEALEIALDHQDTEFMFWPEKEGPMEITFYIALGSYEGDPAFSAPLRDILLKHMHVASDDDRRRIAYELRELANEIDGGSP